MPKEIDGKKQQNLGPKPKIKNKQIFTKKKLNCWFFLKIGKLTNPYSQKYIEKIKNNKF